MVTGHGSLSLYNLVFHSSSKLHLANIDVTLTKFKGVLDYTTTLVRGYSGALVYYLVLLELDHADHTTTSVFIKI